MSSTITQIALPFTILFKEPKPVLEIDKIGTQLLFGESFEFNEQDSGFVKGVNKTDGYEGWVHIDSLTTQTWLPTHFIDALWAPVFPHPGFKNWAMVSLPFMSQIEVDIGKTENEYAYIPSLRGYIHNNHIKPLVHMNKGKQDYVETALRFLEAPYQYGGRSVAGIDCSALVQLSLMRSGISCPRDSGDQEKAMTDNDIDLSNISLPKGLKRGDIVYLKGHVGIMIDEKNIINATSRSMKVQIESIDNFIADYKKQGLEITSVKRF